MAYKSIKYGILTYLTLSFLAPIAHSATYKAPYDNSIWSANTEKLSCTLTHEIPGYGSAIFEQKSGKRQTFALKSSMGRVMHGEIVISQSKPSWAEKSKKTELARVSAKLGLVPVKLKKMTVYQLLDGLEKGMQANFEFRPSNASMHKKAKGRDKIVLSPTGFQEAYQDYLACLDQLVPYTYDELRKTTIFFKSASKALEKDDQARLNSLAELVNHDDSIYKVKIEGHSDSVGSFTSNRRLSYERAWFIKDYLVDEGIHPDKIEVQGLSDRKPIAKNTTKVGRAKNRRVEITLYR